MSQSASPPAPIAPSAQSSLDHGFGPDSRLPIVEMIPATTDVRRNGPVLSASGMEIFAKCDTALARQAEVHRYRMRNALPPASADDSADRGAAIHSVIARLGWQPPTAPFVLRDAEEIRAQVNRVAPSLDRPGRRFVTGAILARNSLFDGLLRSVREHTGEEPKILHVLQDNVRLRAPLPCGEDVSALIDSGLIVSAAGQGFAAVIDYKSGNALAGVRNPQLLTQALLVGKLIRSEDLRIGRVLTTVLNPAALRRDAGPPAAGVFGAPQLEWIQNALDERARVQRQWSNAAAAAEEPTTGVLQPEADTNLNLRASPGSHCLYCSGKVACQSFGGYVRKSARDLVEERPGLVEQGREAFRRNAGPEAKFIAIQALEPSIMTSLHVPLALLAAQEPVAVLKLVEKLRQESEEIVRQLAAAHLREGQIAQAEGRFEDADRAFLAAADVVPGVTFTPGRITWEFAEDPDFPGQDLAPAQVFQRIYPLIAEPLGALIEEQCRQAAAEGQPMPSRDPYDWFLGQDCARGATAVRSFVAAILQVTEEEALRRMVALGIGVNPLRPKVANASIGIHAERMAQLRAEAAAAVSTTVTAAAMEAPSAAPVQEGGAAARPATRSRARSVARVATPPAPAPAPTEPSFSPEEAGAESEGHVATAARR